MLGAWRKVPMRCMGVKDRLGTLLDVSDRKCRRMHEHTISQGLVVQRFQGLAHKHPAT